MQNKKNILFVCTYNKIRSKTAEELYKNDKRFQVKSAGVGTFANVPISRDLILWAEYVIVMEERHLDYIKIFFPDLYEKKDIYCLNIPDVFFFMDEELIKKITETFEDIYQRDIL